MGGYGRQKTEGMELHIGRGCSDRSIWRDECYGEEEDRAGEY